MNSQKFSIIIATFEANTLQKMTSRLSICLIIISLIGCQNQPNNNETITATQEDSNAVASDINSSTEKDINTLIEIYDDPTRVNWQNPDLVVDRIGPYEDKVIADIGAGTGYFTFRLINQAKKVIAIDIEEQFLALIDERKSGLNTQIADKLETRLVLPDNPMLKESEVDIVLLVNTYFNIGSRVDYLKKVKSGLNNKGKIIIVDYKLGDIPAGPPDELKIKTDDVEQELKDAGFNQVLIDTVSLKYQYIVSANQN